MALPRHLKNGLTPLEIEFLAENEMIEISASIDTRQDLEFLGGSVSALKPLQMDDSCACDDIPSADAVRTLLKDLREARQSKARAGVDALGSSYLQMDGIGLMEINEIRPFFTRAHYEAEKLKRSKGISNLIDNEEEIREIFDGAASVGGSIPDSTRFSGTQSSRNY
ncbi:DNA replication protein psf2 [Entomortierella chlamydospora]|nr:DNA replication protein psf2 [Entomortierella chlamydospora]